MRRARRGSRRDAYEQAGRLTSWNIGTTTTGYAYDGAGNRVKAGSTAYTYDARDQLTSDGISTYSYTANGDLSSVAGPSGTVTSTSDAYGQQGAQGSQSSTYDALGRDVQLAVTSGTTTTATALAYEGSTGQLASDGTADYTWTPNGTLAGTASAGGPGAGVLDFTDRHTDLTGQFTASGTTLAGSRAFGPWGAVTATGGTLTGSLGFQSQYTSPVTGQVDMGARWYNPATGSFGNKDTVANRAVPDSASASPFGYAADSPLDLADPTGHYVTAYSGPLTAAQQQQAAAIEKASINAAASNGARQAAAAAAQKAAQLAAAKKAAEQAAAKKTSDTVKSTCAVFLSFTGCANTLQAHAVLTPSPAQRAEYTAAAKVETAQAAQQAAENKVPVKKPAATAAKPKDASAPRMPGGRRRRCRRAGLELGWSGMRGAITVTAAQSRPVGFPLRPQVCCSPHSRRRCDADAARREPAVVDQGGQGPGRRRRSRSRTARGVGRHNERGRKRELDELQARGAYPVEVLDLVRRRFDARPVPAEGSDPGPELGRLREQYQDVSLRTMAASRRELLRARASGAYSTRVLKRVERHLDLTEGSMEQLAQLDV